MISAGRNVRTFLFLCLSVGSSSLSAQDQADDISNVRQDNPAQGFSLFEDIETSDDRGRNTARSARESRATTAQPEFTLVGTSRIGDDYSAILQHRSGETVVVKSAANRETRIPEHTTYSVINIGAGRVSVRNPGGSPCVPFAEQGVSCDVTSDTTVLELATGEAVLDVASTEINLEETVQQVEESDGVTNPFEAARDANAVRDNNNGDGRFRPRRIEPGDVPPGMRVVSTPFGDRLVEQ